MKQTRRRGRVESCQRIHKTSSTGCTGRGIAQENVDVHQVRLEGNREMSRKQHMSNRISERETLEKSMHSVKLLNVGEDIAGSSRTRASSGV